MPICRSNGPVFTQIISKTNKTQTFSSCMCVCHVLLAFLRCRHLQQNLANKPVVYSLLSQMLCQKPCSISQCRLFLPLNVCMRINRSKKPTFLVQDLRTPPPPPLGVKNVKIQENSEKIRGPPGIPQGPSTTLFRPLKLLGALRAPKRSKYSEIC